MPQILLAGKDWKARTLLRAQLIEDGLEVEAYESIRQAAARLEACKALPALVLADLSQSEDPSGETGQLALWSNLLPIWIIAGHELLPAGSLEGRGFEKILFRPLDVGKLAREIKARAAAE